MIHFSLLLVVMVLLGAAKIPLALQKDINDLCRRANVNAMELRSCLEQVRSELDADELDLSFHVSGSWYPLCVASSLEKTKILLEIISPLCFQKPIPNAHHWPLYYSMVELKDSERTRLLLEGGMGPTVQMNCLCLEGNSSSTAHDTDTFNIVYLACSPDVSDIDGEVGDQMEMIIKSHGGGPFVNQIIGCMGLSPLGLLLSNEVIIVPESLIRRLQVLLAAGADPLQPQPYADLHPICMLVNSFSLEYAETFPILFRMILERIDPNHVFEDGTLLTDHIVGHAPAEDRNEISELCLQLVADAKHRLDLIRNAAIKCLIVGQFCKGESSVISTELSDPVNGISIILRDLYIADISQSWTTALLPEPN